MRATKKELRQATKRRQAAFVRLEELAKWGRDLRRAQRAYDLAAAYELALKEGRNPDTPRPGVDLSKPFLGGSVWTAPRVE
jgi:hypothetical protein